MDMGRYLVEAHLREGRSVAELAATHGVNRSWIYKLVARYRDEGDAGLVPRSRRPLTSPTRIALEVEEEILALRKQLADDGLDAGAVTIHWHLLESPPGGAIGQFHLAGAAAAGLRRPPAPQAAPVQPHPLPGGAAQRVLAVRHDPWALADGAHVEIVNFIDDHSRLCGVAGGGGHQGRRRGRHLLRPPPAPMGSPPAVLTDNGCIYTAKHRPRPGGHGDPAGCVGDPTSTRVPTIPRPAARSSASTRPRSASWPASRAAADVAELQAQLDGFVACYNQCRPHRGPGRAHPRRGLRRQGQSPSAAPARPGPFPGPPRQGGQERSGHAALPEPAAPHRHRPGLPRHTGAVVGGRPRRARPDRDG